MRYVEMDDPIEGCFVGRHLGVIARSGATPSATLRAGSAIPSRARLVRGVYTEHIRFAQCRHRECARNDTSYYCVRISIP